MKIQCSTIKNLRGLNKPPSLFNFCFIHKRIEVILYESVHNNGDERPICRTLYEISLKSIIEEGEITSLTRK